MGGTHKRNMRAEKAKVKLKGAKLPKGLNVTKTDFKVRKITIREQLKDSNLVDGHRQLNLKETLSRLKHHSSTFRVEALRNIREALNSGSAGNIVGHLNELIQGIVAVCLDNERDARRESNKTLGSLLAALQTDSVAPFFHVISSYLRCAMTHIQPTIQEDALLMLDVLLQHVPQLLAEHSDKIFQNFLEMISRVRAEGDRAGRTLTIRIGQTHTTIKWRTKVLLRLQQMLRRLVEHNQHRVGIGGIGANVPKLVTFNSKEPQHYSLRRSYAVATCDLSSIFCRTVGVVAAANVAANKKDSISTDESIQLRSYIEHLMPLLLETWLEVRPRESATVGNQVLLTNDAAVTLKIVLGIVEDLLSLVRQHETTVHNYELSTWLQAEYADVFTLNFLNSSFPYQQSALPALTKTSKKNRGATADYDDGGGEYCLIQNLSIANLVIRFFPRANNDQAQKFEAVLQYLETIVTNLHTQLPQYTQIETQRYLALALRAHLLESGEYSLQLHENQSRQLLRATINAFLLSQFNSRDGVAAKVLLLLCEIVQCPRLYAGYGGAAEFSSFLTFLPQLLLKPSITESSLMAMSNLGKQQNEVFLDALTKVIAPVIENIQRIQVSGACNAFEGKKHIMNLFYWTNRGWESDVLLDKLEQHVSDKRIVGYYKFILTQ